MKQIISVIVLVLGLSRYSQAQLVLTLTEDSSQPQSRHSTTRLSAQNVITRRTTMAYTAAKSVSLQPGFLAQAGSVFSASIRSYPFETNEFSTNPLAVKAYPNPFRQETRVEYTLPRSSQVQGVLTNLQGQVLQQSAGGEWQEKGVHHIDLSGSALPAGTYLYQIRTGTEQKTIRLTKQSF